MSIDISKDAYWFSVLMAGFELILAAACVAGSISCSYDRELAPAAVLGILAMCAAWAALFIFKRRFER